MGAKPPKPTAVDGGAAAAPELKRSCAPPSKPEAGTEEACGAGAATATKSEVVDVPKLKVGASAGTGTGIGAGAGAAEQNETGAETDAPKVREGAKGDTPSSNEVGTLGTKAAYGAPSAKS